MSNLNFEGNVAEYRIPFFNPANEIIHAEVNSGYCTECSYVKAVMSAAFGTLWQRYCFSRDIQFVYRDGRGWTRVRFSTEGSEKAGETAKDLEKYLETAVFSNDPVPADSAVVSFLKCDDSKTDSCVTVSIDTDNTGRISFAGKIAFSGEKFLEYFRKITEEYLCSPDVKTGSINLLSSRLEEAYSRINDISDCEELDAVSVFSDIAGRYPENRAIVCGDTVITYRELDVLSSRYSEQLKEKGVSHGDIVAVVSDRNPGMPVTLAGILKCGAAYMPVDPEYPDERIKNILASSGAAFLADTSSGDYSRFGMKDVSADITELRNSSSEGFVSDTAPDDAAYVMYTSGTSGEPKGAVICHKSIVRLVKDTNYISFSPETRLLQTSSVVFDASTLEIWGPLLNGGTVYMTDKKNILDPDSLESTIEKYDINAVFLSTSLFAMLAESRPEIFRNLEYLVAGGDVMPYRQSMDVLERCPDIKLVNGYGPTENTTFSTAFTVTKESANPLPIGTPVRGSTAWIFDCFGNLQPEGFAGELYTGGLGVAREYYRNQKLTSEKFTEIPGYGRMYRTSDFASISEDGTITYHGRCDDQVKIRGYRIELAEVREKMLGFPEAGDAYVSVLKNRNGAKVLAAFVSAPEDISDKLKEYLHTVLPEYMIPDIICTVEKFPLTINGKTDRTALEKLAERRFTDSDSSFTGIWRSVLDRDDFTENDDFFESGGDSLKVIKLITEMKKAGYSYTVQNIYDHPSVSDLTESVTSGISVRRRGVTDRIPLTMAQEGIWFNCMNEPVYNVVLSVTIKSAIDTGMFEEAIRQTVRKYPDLRTVVEEDGYTPYMKVADYCEEAADIITEDRTGCDADSLRMEYEKTECMRVYDLKKLPMYHFRIGILGEDRYILTIGSHHVISDAYAVNILIKRIEEEYFYLTEGTEPGPHSETVDFSDYALWQKENRKMLCSKAGYWRKKLEGKLSIVNFPEIENPVYGEHEGGVVKINLGTEKQQKLSEIFRRHGASEFAGYSALFFIFLRGMLGIRDISIGTATSGRDLAEIQDTMGNFAYASVLRNSIDLSDSFEDIIAECRTTAEEAGRNQGLPFEKLMILADIDRKYFRLPYIILIEYIKNNTPSERLDISLTEYSEYVVPSDFSLFVQSEDDATYLRFYYRKNLFYDDEAEDYASIFERITDYCIENSSAPVEKIIEREFSDYE